MSSTSCAQITITDLADYTIRVEPSLINIPANNDGSTSSGSVTLKVFLLASGEPVQPSSLKLDDMTGSSPTVGIAQVDVSILGNSESYWDDTLKCYIFPYTWSAMASGSADTGYKSLILTKDNLIFQDFVYWAKNKQGQPGSDGDDGVSVVSITPYYQMADTKPSKPATNPPVSPWSTDEPQSSDFNYNLYRVDLTIFSDNTWEYTDVITSTAFNAARDIFNDLNTLSDNVEGFFVYDPSTSTYSLTEDAFKVIKNRIDMAGANINFTAEQYNVLANEIYNRVAGRIIQAVENGDKISALEQTANGFSAWVAENTADGQDIRSQLRFTSNGLELSKTGSSSSDGLYKVVIANDGMRIVRSEQAISRFRKEQLTVSNIRLASPSSDSANRIAIKEAPDGGMMWVLDYAITE